MSMRRLGRDPVMGDIVRQRLEALVAEIAPQRAAAAQDRWNAPEPAAGAPRRAAPRPGDNPVRRAWEFGRSHVAVVAVLGLVAVGWAVVGMTQARTVTVAATPVPMAPTTPVASPEPEEIQVHVVGAVTRAGVVRLAVGARVADAVAAAGGVTPDAHLGELNLAAVVTDGAQVVVGTGSTPSEVRDGGSPAAARGAAASPQVNLNTATVEQLEGLPGVGPVTAERIVAWRTQHQRFTRVEELQEVDGIGAKTFAQLKPHVRV